MSNGYIGWVLVNDILEAYNKVYDLEDPQDRSLIGETISIIVGYERETCRVVVNGDALEVLLPKSLRDQELCFLIEHSAAGMTTPTLVESQTTSGFVQLDLDALICARVAGIRRLFFTKAESPAEVA